MCYYFWWSPWLIILQLPLLYNIAITYLSWYTQAPSVKDAHGPYPMNRADLQLCSVSSLCRICYVFDPWCICATTNNNLPCFPVGHETKLQFCWVHFHVVVFHQRLLDLAQHISLRSCIQACHVSLRLQTSGGMFTVWINSISEQLGDETCNQHHRLAFLQNRMSFILIIWTVGSVCSGPFVEMVMLAK